MTRSFSAFALGTILSVTTLGRAAQTTPRVAVTTVKLERYGWEPPGPGSWEDLGYAAQQVAFDSKGNVVVGFTVRSGPPRLSTRSHPGFEYRVLRLSPSGELLESVQARTGDQWGGVYLDSHDDIVVRADGWVQVLTPGAGRAATENWTKLAACPPSCYLAESPSRRTFLLTMEPGPRSDRYLVTVVSPESRGIIAHCAHPLTVIPKLVSITDTYAYFNADPGNLPTHPSPVLYRWPLCDYSRRVTIPVHQHGPVHAPTDDELFLESFYPQQREVTFYAPNGRPLNVLKLPIDKHEGARVALSQNAQRALVSVVRYEGGAAWLDISPHTAAQRMIVLNISTGAQLADIPVPTAKGEPPAATAISPDGRRVAALANGTLTIASLP